uniref:HPS5-like beta-propeller domain-containing protein n=1 Tax=Dendroctonus ponderosae TaxID=77166 RepID=A0AAR5PIE2_DENPD
MENDFVFVEYLSNINTAVKHTFQSMQRVKLRCFDVSSTYLVFGASSGGIYIFKRNPYEFIKLIPSRDGPTKLIAISPDEHHISVVCATGLILILQNFIEDAKTQTQVFNEHEGKQVTYIKWHRNELYVGDETGKISVVSVVVALFQIPSAALMTIVSPIVQIDAYESLLLVSTQEKTYLCNTTKRLQIQIGKKLRSGCFGACFSASSNESAEMNSVHNTRKAFQSVKENELLLTGDHHLNTKIFCARPGARLWEVGLDAKVRVTHQFREALSEESSSVLIIGCEEESVLQKTQRDTKQTVPHSFNFCRIYPVCDTFVLTYDSKRLYIFDPGTSKLVYWTTFSSGIKQVAIVNNEFYILKNNLNIIVLSVIHLERLILTTLYKKQFYLCMGLCIEFKEKILQMLESSKKLFLLSLLKSKLNSGELEYKTAMYFRENSSNQLENLHTNEADCLAVNKVHVEDELGHFNLLMKQFKLNKTHQTIEIPEVRKYLQAVNADELFELLKQFSDHVNKKFGENATEWCQHQYLKLIASRCMFVEDLPNENWYFVKLNRGACLNCDKSIDTELMFTWTQVGKVCIQSLGAKNTLRIMEKYDQMIPNGALDVSFYQTCVFSHISVNANSTSKIKAEAPSRFLEDLDEMSKLQFQEGLAKYFQRKYSAEKNSCFDFGLDNSGVCLLCKLPLKNAILFETDVAKGCDHQFHKFCLERNGQHKSRLNLTFEDTPEA